MSDPAVVADTSVLIHFMEGHPKAGEWLMGREVHISVVTEIELRTMSAIKKASKPVIDKTLAMCSIWDISPSIKERCIRSRSTHRMKLADALIAATAASLNVPLLTSDKNFNRLEEEVVVRML